MPARHTRNSQNVLPVTRVIQSTSGETTLRKHCRPSMINFSNDAPDFPSVECTGTRAVAPPISASNDAAVQGRFVRISARPFQLLRLG